MNICVLSMLTPTYPHMQCFCLLLCLISAIRYKSSNFNMPKTLFEAAMVEKITNALKKLIQLNNMNILKEFCMKNRIFHSFCSILFYMGSKWTLWGSAKYLKWAENSPFLVMTPNYPPLLTACQTPTYSLTKILL